MISKNIFRENHFSHIFMLLITASACLQANPFRLCCSHKKIQNDVYNPSVEMEPRPVIQNLDLKSLNVSAATSQESITNDNQEIIFSPRLKLSNQNKTRQINLSDNPYFCYNYYHDSQENLAQLAIDEPNKSFPISNPGAIFSEQEKPADLRLVALRIRDYKNENYKYIN